MKIKKILSYVFGTLLILLALILFSTKEVGSCLEAVSFLFLAVLIYPSFDIICKLTNKDFSFSRKAILGIATFMIPPVLFSSKETTMSHISTLIVVLLVFWTIMFITNKKQYINASEGKLMKKSDKSDFFHKIFNNIIEKRNAKVIYAMQCEQEVKNNFLDLNIMTTNAIAKMLSKTRSKHNSVFNQDMPEIKISYLVMAFCKDSQKIENEFELNNLYSNNYYINIVNKCCPELVGYIKNKIRESLPSQTKNRYIEYYNKYLNILTNEMNTFSSIKFYKTISTSGQEYKNIDQLGVDTLDYRYKDAFSYLIDSLTTCTCISKMIFVERKVKNLKHDNEFYKIISNMAKEISDVDLIIKKSRPIYDEFYKSQLGFINDEFLYGIAIATLSNRVINKQLSKQDENIINVSEDKYNNIVEFDEFMRRWIYDTANKYRNLEIYKYVIFKVTNSIELANFDLYFESLSRADEYAMLYCDRVNYNNKTSDKERYLNGDFDKEKKELSGKYSLNNIVTGTQFEVYLANLFKELGYKSKHNGKSGDQGADLILQKDNYVYAVQAKYYSGKLSNTPVQEISGALKYYNANQGVVITNSSFTAGAEELAKANNVILIDGKDLKKLADYAFDDNHEADVLKKFEKCHYKK